MKAIYLNAAGAIALTFTIAACVPSVEMPIIVDTPAPVARPAPSPSPTPVAVAQPEYENYLDAPQTPGNWTYRQERAAIGLWSSASFVSPSGEELFSVQCKFGDNIGVARSVRTVRNLNVTIRTETATHSRLAPPDPEGQNYVNLVFRPFDPFLDAMAITKGRFAVETDGLPTLYLPAWVEVSRVIEDCR